LIPRDFVTEWRQYAPWIQDHQVEQDLILSRALVEIFANEEIATAFAFRGGTALYKLHLLPAIRYSEDIDLVQVAPGPIGHTVDAIRSVLDAWLGTPRRSFKEGRVTLKYRVSSEGPPSVPIRVKIEINSREHFCVFGHKEHEFAVESRWYSGSASIVTFQLEELLGTKLRALYQRKKGRDLFDLWTVSRRAHVNPDRIIECFLKYLSHEGLRVSRAEFEENLADKLADPTFTQDIPPLLAPGAEWNPEDAAKYVREELLSRLPGHTWKGRPDK
jgi:predicted nucleotidyltransferase component of viral defense system